jgi:hypothetical protein
MYTQQVSARELEQHWKALELQGGSMDCIPRRYLPAWNDLCSHLAWEVYRLDDGYFSKKYFGCCGVYRLVGLESESDLRKPVPLNRVCGQDISGTLYIGEAGSLNNRLNQLRRTLLRKENSHNAASVLKHMHVLKSKFSPNKLAVAVMFTGRSTRYVENNLLEAYMNSFGDTPPLNYEL